MDEEDTKTRVFLLGQGVDAERGLIVPASSSFGESQDQRLRIDTNAQGEAQSLEAENTRLCLQIQSVFKQLNTLSSTHWALISDHEEHQQESVSVHTDNAAKNSLREVQDRLMQHNDESTTTTIRALKIRIQGLKSSLALHPCAEDKENNGQPKAMVGLTTWMDGSDHVAATSHTPAAPRSSQTLTYPLASVTATVGPALPPHPALTLPDITMSATVLDRPQSEHCPAPGKRKRAASPGKVKGPGMTLRSRALANTAEVTLKPLPATPDFHVVSHIGEAKVKGRGPARHWVYLTHWKKSFPATWEPMSSFLPTVDDKSSSQHFVRSFWRKTLVHRIIPDAKEYQTGFTIKLAKD